DDDSAFPLDALRQMIAATGRATNEAALTYMRAALDMYQNAYRAVAPMVPSAPPTPPPRGGASAPTPAGREEDVERLKKRLAELEAAVARIGPTRRSPKRGSKKRR